MSLHVDLVAYMLILCAFMCDLVVEVAAIEL